LALAAERSRRLPQVGFERRNRDCVLSLQRLAKQVQDVVLTLQDLNLLHAEHIERDQRLVVGLRASILRRRDDPMARTEQWQESALAGVFAFAVGAVMYYAIFYRSRLIPRWLSGWGIVGVILMLGARLSALFTRNPLTSYVILAIPIAVQEMVLTVWLIARGFNPAGLQPADPVE